MKDRVCDWGRGIGILTEVVGWMEVQMGFVGVGLVFGCDWLCKISVVLGLVVLGWLHWSLVVLGCVALWLCWDVPLLWGKGIL